MFIFSKYIIMKERDDCLEFIEKRSVGILLGLFFVLFGLIILHNAISFDFEKNPWIRFFMYAAASCFILAGVFRFCIRASINIDKKKKTLTYNSGLKNMISKPLKITFDKISHITIATEYTQERLFPEYQVINIITEDNKTVTLDKSSNDLYINEFSVKISDAIGCDVIVIS